MALSQRADAMATTVAWPAQNIGCLCRRLIGWGPRVSGGKQETLIWVGALWSEEGGREAGPISLSYSPSLFVLNLFNRLAMQLRDKDTKKSCSRVI